MWVLALVLVSYQSGEVYPVTPTFYKTEASCKIAGEAYHNMLTNQIRSRTQVAYNCRWVDSHATN